MGLGILFGLIPLFILLACVVGLIYIWVKVFFGGANPAKGDDLARCGQCGYPARGAAGLDCVECGADLREVGIVTAAQAKPMIRPLAFILLWTLCLPIPALMVAGILIAIGPKHSFQSQMATLTPASGQFVSIDFNDMNNMYGWLSFLTPAASTHLQSSLSLSISGHNNAYDFLMVDPVNMTFDASFISFPLPASTTPGSATTPTATAPSATASNSTAVLSGQPVTTPLDAAVLLAWFGSIGADVTNPDVINEADELLQYIREQPTHGLNGSNVPIHFNRTSQSSYPVNLPKAWWAGLVLLAMPLLWVGGIVLYFLIRRRRTPLPALQQARHPYGPARFAPPGS